ncbi:MAG: DJ-1/PfpI family protein [Blautia sp.]|nr:DJ-1/PfpI family protein [Blautia sp.]
MSKVYVFLADGFEDIEALTMVDMLRRAQIPVSTVSITDTLEVTTSHQVTLKTDVLFKDCDFSDADVLVLPGGMPGTANLRAFEPLMDLLKAHYAQGKRLAAICAAPTILSDLGILKGKKATSYPARREDIECGEYLTDPVVVDGTITTSRGMGTSIDFALCLIAQLAGQEKSEQLAAAIVYARN